MRHKLIIFLLLLSTASADAYAESADFVRFEAAKNLFKKGNVFFNNMQYLAAADYFRKAVQKYSEYHTAREYLARSYKLAGLTDAAQKEWENLHDIYPENVAVLAKIDSLRFSYTVEDEGFDSGRYVFDQAYRSVQFKRFGFRHPLDLALDNEKNLYITSFSSGKLVKIDVNGRGLGISKGDFSSKLYGIDCHDGIIAATDFLNDRFYLLNAGGDIIKRVGSTGSGNGQFHGPEGICFDDGGNIFVVDSANHRVQKFDGDGNYLLQFGKPGEYEEELKNPTDAVCIKGTVYVTDTGNRRIASFDDSGNFIKNIEVPGLEKPRGISKKGDMLLLSDEKKGLLFYNPGTGASSWFSTWDGGRKGFSTLVSSVFDRDDYLYCLDYNRESVYIFSHEKKRYSNLDVEITSVDIKSFPVVAFYVNIRGRDGKPVYGLKASNFLLTEDSAPIAGIYADYLKKVSPSVSVVLCVDRSRANEKNHGEIPWVADFLMKKMKKNDSIKVLNFSGDVWDGSPFDWSRRRTVSALSKKNYGPGRSVGKALYAAISDLLPRVNRRGVLLITDGAVSEDSFAVYSPEDIVRYARSHYIPIFIVSFKEPHPSLAAIARETGGALYRPGNLDGLRSIYGDIKNSEEYRYVLVYSTYKLPAFRGWWSDVKIEVELRGEKGHEWGGYFVP